MLKQTIGGGGGEQISSPYVLSYFDMVELAQGKVINVTQLIELLETKFDNFDNIEVGDNGSYLIASLGYAGHDGSKYLDLLHLETNSDDGVDIVLSGDYLTSVDTTKNIKQVLLLKQVAIENVVLNSLKYIDLDTISVITCAVDKVNVKPCTYSEFKSLFINVI